MAKRLWELFYTFAKVGVMTFGGGYAMLPILQREVVENKGWATEEELADWFAIGQCTPGVIAVNTATFAGRKVLGNIGGVAATLGVVFPSLIIISLLAGVITTFAEVAWVRNAFAGIRVCVCVLIFNAVVKLWKKSVVDKKTLALYAVILLASLLTDLSPVIFVLFAAVSEGESELENVLLCDDTIATADCLSRLGTGLELGEKGRVRVTPHPFVSSEEEL